MASKRMFNLGAGGSPLAFAVDALPLGGDLGGLFEDNSQNRYQCFQVVDANIATKKIVYAKAHNGSYTATPTVANSSRNEACGVTTGAITANQYALLAQGGVFDVTYTGTAALTGARGSRVVPDGVGANNADFTNAGTAIVLAGNQNVNHIGIAQADASGGLVSTFLTIQPI